MKTRDIPTAPSGTGSYNRLYDLWRMLLRRWWIPVLAGLLGALAGIAYAWLQKPRYEARLTFALEDSGGGLSGALSLAADLGFNLGASGKDVFGGENIVPILTSRRMVENVLLSVDTIDGKPVTLAQQWYKIRKTDFTKHPRLAGVGFPVGQPREQFSYLQDSLLFVQYETIIKTMLTVRKPEKRWNLFEVKFVSPDQRFSRLFTERLVREATEYYTELKSRRSRETLEILEARVASVKGTASSAIRSQAAIRDANVNPAFAAANAGVLQRQLDVSAYGKAYEELFKNLELARYQYLKDIPLLQVIDEPRYPMKNLKKGRLRTGIIFGMLAGLLSVILLMLWHTLRWQAARPGQWRPD